MAKQSKWRRVRAGLFRSSVNGEEVSVSQNVDGCGEIRCQGRPAKEWQVVREKDNEVFSFHGLARDAKRWAESFDWNSAE